MRKRRRSTRQADQKRQKKERTVSACFSGDDESSTSDQAEVTPTEVENVSSGSNSDDDETVKNVSESAVVDNTQEDAENEDMMTPLKDPAPETDDEYGSDDEQSLVGSCGDVTFGCDPGPVSHQKLLGKFVALEFAVEGKSDLVMYTGEVTKYMQATDKFEVRKIL